MRKTKISSGTRKHGRQKNSPSHQRYNNERRWETNKEHKIEREAKRIKKLKKRNEQRTQETNKKIFGDYIKK